MIVRGKYEHKSIVQGHFAAHETGVGVVQGNSLQNKLVLSSTPALKQQFDNIKTAVHTPALQTNSCLTTSNIKPNRFHNMIFSLPILLLVLAAGLAALLLVLTVGCMPPFAFFCGEPHFVPLEAGLLKFFLGLRNMNTIKISQRKNS